MNPIQKALDEIKFTIPRQILNEVFITRNVALGIQPTSIENQIYEEVIKPRVLIDCNLIGGTEAIIDLSNIVPTRINQYTSVYKIPKSRTQGRSIISVLNITFSDPTATSNYGTATGCGASSMLTTGQALIDAAGSLPITSTAHVQLVSENTVMVRDTALLPANIYLRCILANDENLSHLQLKSYRNFAFACGLATKSYIYNQYVITMDVGQLYGGQMIGRFKEIIDGWSDAEELYQTYMREKMQKIFVMNDTESYVRFMKNIIGGRR